MNKFLPLLPLLCFLSCARPASEENFILAEDAGGVYSFPVVMTDSLAHYTVSFYTATDTGRPEQVRLYVKWVSPSGNEYEEAVYMKVGEEKGDRCVYRTGIRPLERGEWRLDIIPYDSPVRLRGMGVIVEEHR